MDDQLRTLLHASFFFSSDVIIIGCHIAISLLFVRLAWRRKDIDTNGWFWFFTFTILSRALIHTVMAWNVLHGNFTILVVTKLVYVTSSIGMLYLLWKVFPQLVTMPSLQHLKEVNQQLHQSIVALTQEKEERARVQQSLAQSQKMEAVGQLTGGIAHDFNNLLQAIGGNLELIKRNPLSIKVDRWLGNSIESVARAAHLTGQLLTFSRDQKLELQEVSLAACMHQAKELMARVIGMTAVLVMGKVDDVTIMVDPVQLELALLNLSLNARDAIDNKGTITFSTQLLSDTVEINIADTGHGIPDDIITRIFDPFFTTKDIGKGTGLGLSMVHSVMTQFGGDVYIKQTSPQGTIVTLSLPYSSTILPTIDQQEKQSEFIVHQDQHHILIIDDERLVREILTDMVQEAGYVVTACDDGAEALVFLKTHKPDLVLCDFAMPMMNGEEVMKAIRLIHPDLPLVFVTGYAKSEAMKDHVVLKKPFNAQDIKTVIQKVLES